MISSHPSYYWRIAGFYFFYFAFVGLFSPYWSLYLKSLGFNAVQIGVLMSAQPVMRMLAPALWGWLADRLGNRRMVVQLAALGSVLAYLGVFFTTDYIGLLLVLALMSVFWSASMPLVEATTLTYLGKNAARYGRLRSWGSVGFILAVLGLGFAFDYIAIGWILWAGLVIQLGILFFSRLMPSTVVVAHHTDSHSIMRIVMQPAVLALFGACFLMAVAHGPYYTFFSIYLVEHGYAKSAVGALWTLGVVCEIGVFFAMPWLMRHFSLPQILMVSLLLAVLRFLLIGWQVDTMWLLLLAQIMHAVTFGSFHAAAVALVHHFFRGRHQSKGQALFGSVTYGAGGMLGGLLSGPLWLHWGASVMYSFSAGAALLGFGLMWWKFRNMEIH
ncbi:MAG: MFS transporter [Gallionellales bacterium 35-53-114]|jgi:PPP family 3-phenylpropionic acid transporter|nr:MAG: MFS transporter [Gallionellales bacterium 35-53-114]OYZ62802.1 MAG: MFS transporter [Gallionellales bacterium 24-53-125]OZB09877.1 MAG: MFS transporter [Gallionellales bacterium 39-52-133]HQS57555.1 MFS transporter [Gallionellaceae bacterium]HQS74009.1 MFS transporter [Gallionellaceae bacterium]